MPDDSDKVITIPQLSPESHDMGGLWDSGSDKKNIPAFLPPLESDCLVQNESPSLSPSNSLVVHREHNLDTLSTDSGDAVGSSSWISNSFGASAGSRVPFTKREKEFLCCLIQKHVYLKMGQSQTNLPTLGAFNQKNTISTFCRVPNAAWKAIASEYNSKDNVRQRSIKQLRKCWENLKHRGNIDPAALYSGKKLQGKTSLSGAFTLTAEGGENAGMKLALPKDAEVFIETTMEEVESPGVIDTPTDLTSPPRDTLQMSRELMPTDLSLRGKRSSESQSTIFENESFQKTHSSSANNKIIDNNGIHPSGRSSSFLSPIPMASESSSCMEFPTSRSNDSISKITNVRTVRSLKPDWSQPVRRRMGSIVPKERTFNSRFQSNFSIMAKTNSHKIQEMKLKLLASRIKEHESNIERVKLQMEHAQAQHDVHMRLLRTKAAWYDAHLRKLENQLRSGDIAQVGEENEKYHCDDPDEMTLHYDNDFD